MPDIGDLFPADNNEIPHELRGLTRENAGTRLVGVQCPACNSAALDTFAKAMHVGIVCRGCGREHVLRRYGIMWLPSADNAWRRGNP